MEMKNHLAKEMLVVQMAKEHLVELLKTNNDQWVQDQWVGREQDQCLHQNQKAWLLQKQIQKEKTVW